MSSANFPVQPSLAQTITALIRRVSSIVRVAGHDGDAQHALVEMRELIDRLNQIAVQGKLESSHFPLARGTMLIYISVGAKSVGKISETFLWPDGEPLVIPREGEYVDFAGHEPKLVRRVTYSFALDSAVTPEIVKLTIHIQTV